jgi:L,D-peptidoglycan transpeptidase YkuD (ErfK/YbiS/YcfS/YnhG family)
MMEWGKQNERFILFRNYKRTVEFANISSESSRNAIENTKKNISKVEDILKSRIEKIGKRIKDFEAKYGSFPMNSMHRNEIVKSELQYSEALLAYKNKNYTSCKSKLDSVENTINQVYVLYEKKFGSYLNENKKWKIIVNETINYSKKNKTYIIIIDKLGRECAIYKNGKQLNTFSVELGPNWIGDKKQQGDKSTPEGLYSITEKKRNGQTRFYKALLLDYPNKEDRKRFKENKKSGHVAANAKIGNLIEIHGNGGKGVDWTDGCIALKDTDMDVVFKLCPVGTKVAIVGSAK